MAWRELTMEGLKARLEESEIAALTKASTSTITASVVSEVFKQVTDEVRGDILSNPNNIMGPANTLPDQVFRHAYSLLRFTLCNRLGIGAGNNPNTDTRKVEYEDAVKYFDAVSRGDKNVEQPERVGQESFGISFGQCGSEERISL